MITALQNLVQKLIQAQEPGDSMNIIEEALQARGFETEHIPRGRTTNLVAFRAGQGNKMSLLFLGHADVVPAGRTAGEWKSEGWLYDPFGGGCHDGKIFGRGAVDMKGAMACFLEALDSAGSALNITVLISGDEEGDGTDGTPFVLKTLEQRGKASWDFALIGEPTSRETLGDHVKIGCRGSVNLSFTVRGNGGHVAYPELLNSPIQSVGHFLANVEDHPFEDDDPVFGKTHMEVTAVVTDSGACNVVPSEAKIFGNIRFSPQVSPQDIESRIESWVPRDPGIQWQTALDWQSQPLHSSPSPHLDSLLQSVERVTHRKPKVSAQGASSDARFLPLGLPFAEFGLRVQEAHKVNEYVTLKDIERLKGLYAQILKDWANC